MVKDARTAIFNAWDKDTDGGRDEDAARKLADKYVDDHPDEFVKLAALGDDQAAQEMLVSMIDKYREHGDEDGVHRIQIWLWHHFEPQQIGGPVTAQVRTVS